MKSFVLLEKWKKFRRIEFLMWYQKKNKSFYHGKKTKQSQKTFWEILFWNEKKIINHA